MQSMTKERMDAMLRTTSGVGVKTTDNNDEAHYYFYEDFANDDGMDRAMKQTYPALIKGLVKKVEFIVVGA